MEIPQHPGEPDLSYILESDGKLEPVEMVAGTFTFMGMHDVFERLYNKIMETKEVPIINFIEGYKEISKLFDVLGKVFYFVKADVDYKVNLLEDMYIKKNQACKTVEQIIRYEVNNNITETYYRSNGSRTILRLIRALDFVASFMELAKTNPSLLLREVVQNAYDSKLAPFHTWAVRKAVGLATFTLPHRDQFMAQIGADDEKIWSGGPYDNLVIYLKTAAEVPMRTFKEFNLENLP